MTSMSNCVYENWRAHGHRPTVHVGTWATAMKGKGSAVALKLTMASQRAQPALAAPHVPATAPMLTFLSGL